jgi:hypothetical protein
MKVETCKNCGRTIGKLEQAYVFHENVVCQDCYAKLTDAEDKQVIPAIKESFHIKRLCFWIGIGAIIIQWLCLWIGIGVIILLCLFPPWWIYLATGFGEPDLPTYTICEHHWRNWDTEKAIERFPANQARYYRSIAIIAYPRLAMECVIVAIVTGGLFVTFNMLKNAVFSVPFAKSAIMVAGKEKH